CPGSPWLSPFLQLPVLQLGSPTLWPPRVGGVGAVEGRVERIPTAAARLHAAVLDHLERLHCWRSAKGAAVQRLPSVLESALENRRTIEDREGPVVGSVPLCRDRPDRRLVIVVWLCERRKVEAQRYCGLRWHVDVSAA